MATIILNPVLNSISGRMGSVVFYRRRNAQCVRSYIVPINPDTESQRSVRTSFANAVKSWQNMTEDERYKYIRKARNLNMSGYNLYISEFLKGKKDNLTNPIRKEIPGRLYFFSIQRQFPSV